MAQRVDITIKKNVRERYICDGMSSVQDNFGILTEESYLDSVLKNTHPHKHNFLLVIVLIPFV